MQVVLQNSKGFWEVVEKSEDKECVLKTFEDWNFSEAWDFAVQVQKKNSHPMRCVWSPK